MVPASCNTSPVPPPAYHRAQAKVGRALLDALTLVTRLHLLALCRLAVRLARRRCPPPLSAVPADVRGATLRSRCCCSPCCGPCGACPTRTCTTGW